MSAIPNTPLAAFTPDDNNPREFTPPHFNGIRRYFVVHRLGGALSITKDAAVILFQAVLTVQKHDPRPMVVQQDGTIVRLCHKRGGLSSKPTTPLQSYDDEKLSFRTTKNRQSEPNQVSTRGCGPCRPWNDEFCGQMG